MNGKLVDLIVVFVCSCESWPYFLFYFFENPDHTLVSYTLLPKWNAHVFVRTILSGLLYIKWFPSRPNFYLFQYWSYLAGWLDQYVRLPADFLFPSYFMLPSRTEHEILGNLSYHYLLKLFGEAYFKSRIVWKLRFEMGSIIWRLKRLCSVVLHFPYPAFQTND